MNITKRLYRFAAAAAILVVAANASAQFIPSNIEPERVRPQANIDLPRILTVPNAVDIFFEPSPPWSPKKGEVYPMVHMRIPKAPYFDKNSASGPTRKYEMYIKMFYPNFSGLADKENAECRSDVKEALGNFGHCRREMTVGFGFAFKPAMSEELEFQNLQTYLKNGYIEPLESKSKYPGLTSIGVQGKGEGRETFYTGKKEDGRGDYVFRCSEYVPSPACETVFRSDKSPYIFIHLSFVLPLLQRWKDVITDTRKKIDSMIVQTYKLQPRD